MTSSVELEPLAPSHEQELVSLLAEEPWPFHVGGTPTADAVRARLREGRWHADGVRTWWVVADAQKCGMVTVDDLDDVPDGAPVLDVRLRASPRGRGLGTAAVLEVVDGLFGDVPDLRRIEATTRIDNVAMRRALEWCLFVKEAHYRCAWPVEGAAPLDSIGYGLLREDWESGTPTRVDWST